MRTRNWSAPTRQWPWVLLPLAAGVLADLVLLPAIAAEALDGRLLATLAGQVLLHSIAVVSALATLWVGVTLIASLAAAPGSSRRRFLYAAGVLAGALVIDAVTWAPMFTGHWTLMPIRVLGLVSSGVLVVAHASAARFRQFLVRRLGMAEGLIAVTTVAVVLVFGMSLLPHTPKYLRESIAGLIILQIQLAWVLASLRFDGVGRRHAGFALVSSAAVFAVCVALTGALSERSTHVVTTTLEYTRSVRGWNRSLVRALRPDDWSFARTLAGGQRTPGRARGQSTGRLRCETSGSARVRSVLIISIDALRADYYGVPMHQLPALRRLAGESLRFSRANQACSATAGSIFALHSGRYATAPAVRRDVLKEAARQLELEYSMVEFAPPQTMTSEALARLAAWKEAGRPFVMHVHYLPVHLPAGFGRWRHSYADQLRVADAQLAQLLGFLDEQGLAGETAVVLTADHGEDLQWERGQVSHGNGVSQTLLHTPLMLRAPGIEPGVRTQFVSGADVYPTVLELLGARCDSEVHGVSLLASPLPGRVVFSSSAAPYRVPGVDYLVYSDRHAVVMWPWKLVFDRAENSRALYRLDRDPSERHNLVDAHPGRMTRLMLLLQAYLDGRPPISCSDTTCGDLL